MTPDLSPISGGPPRTRLDKLHVTVTIIAIIATTIIMVLGYVKPRINELDECRKMLEVQGGRLTELERDTPSREKHLREELATTHDELLKRGSLASELRDRVSSLERELASEQEAGAKLRADLEMASRQASELRSLMSQDQPVILATADLKRGERHTFSAGIVLEFTGVTNNMVTFTFDGSKRIGIPLQTLNQFVPLRANQNGGGFLGIQPQTLWERQRVVRLNLIQFPAKWSFLPAAPTIP